MYASSSRRGIGTTIHIVEEKGELGKSKGVMIWLRFSCNLMSEVKGKPRSSMLPRRKSLANIIKASVHFNSTELKGAFAFVVSAHWSCSPQKAVSVISQRKSISVIVRPIAKYSVFCKEKFT
jgi:hypothetical protein